MSKSLKLKITNLVNEQIYVLNEGEKVFIQKFDTNKYTIEDIGRFHESIKENLPKSIRLLTFPSDVEIEVWEAEE